MSLDSLLSLAEGPPVGQTGFQSVPSIENADVGLLDGFELYAWSDGYDDAGLLSDGFFFLERNEVNPTFCPVTSTGWTVAKLGEHAKDVGYVLSGPSGQLTPPSSVSPQLTGDDKLCFSKASSASLPLDFFSAVRVSLAAETLRLEDASIPTVLPAASPSTRDASATLSPDCMSEPLTSCSPQTPKLSPLPLLPNSSVVKREPEPLSPPPELVSASPHNDVLVKIERFSPVSPSAPRNGGLQMVQADESSLPILPSDSVKVDDITADASAIAITPSTLSNDVKRKARAARKRQQNKDAAVRYRLRKQQEQKQLHDVCEELRAENAELLRRRTRLINEIAYVRELVEEVMKARKERAASTKASGEAAKAVTSK